MTTAGFQRLFQQPEWWFGVIGVAGSAWLWFVLSRHGIGLSPDSVGYLAVAQNIIEGHGLVSYQGHPFVAQPPLYPLCIAGLSYLSSLSPVASALVINLALFGLIIFLSGKLSFLVTNSIEVSIITCFSVFFGIPIFWVSLFAWSELLFISTLMCSLMMFHEFLSKNREKYIFFCGIFVGFSFLVRYIGFMSIISISILLILSYRKNLRKIHFLFYFIASSLFLPSVILIRNYVVSQTFFGSRSSPSIKVRDNLFLFSDAFFNWIIAPFGSLLKTPIPIGIMLVFTSLLLISYLIYTLYYQYLTISILLLFIIVYLFFILFSSTQVAYDPIDNRLLSPVFVPFSIVLIHFFSEILYPILHAKLPERMERFVVMLGMLVWFTYPVLSTVTLALEVRQEGKGYHSRQWQNSETMAYAREAREQLTRLPTYTNDPEGMYFLAQITAEHLPFQVRDTWPESGYAYVVRFNYAYRGECLDQLEQLRRVANITLHRQFSDGEIYLVTRKTLE